MTDRMGTFNQLTGIIFAQLLRDFPARSSLNDRELLKEICYLESDGRNIVYGTVRWLRDEGFINGKGEVPLHDITLTAKALAVLNTAPESLEERTTFGERVSAASREAGSEAGRAAISAVVGQILGAAARAFST